MKKNENKTAAVPIPKLKKFMVFCIIFFVVSIFVSVISFFSADDEYKLINAETAENITDINANLMTTDVVQFKDLIIIDKYATYGNESNDKNDEFAYYLAAFKNNASGEEKLYYASICYDVGSEGYNQIEAYINDENQQIGELSMPVCAISFSEDEKAKEYYAQAMNLYNETFGEKIPDSNLRLKYAFDDESQLEDYQNSQNDYFVYVAVGCAAMAVFCLAGFISSKKKIKAYNKNNASLPFDNTEVKY